MGRRGNPCDDAKAASFLKTLKHEEVHLNGYETVQDVARLPRSLKEGCHTIRLHSALGYLSPAQFEEVNTRKAACPRPPPARVRGAAQISPSAAPSLPCASASGGQRVW
jgi:transposase InsO family protein